MRTVDLIAKKRDGQALTREEVGLLVRSYVQGDIPDYQMAAFLMAVYLRGMQFEEAAWLTRAMIDSGKVLDLTAVPPPLIDKHSTGGVGDKVSLVLAPVAAACGLRVPMMSGRSLGHTGGTLDKLESIPGYRTDLSHERFVQALVSTGFAMIGQSDEVAPADKMMYALRDVTATVESIPLITASILSKKCAEGAVGLVFDVKSGSGAFMKRMDDARALAQSLVRTAKLLGRAVVAVISDMEQPLGRTVGNFLEVREAIECLQGRGPADLRELTLRLAGWMLVLGGRAADHGAGAAIASAAIASGSAWKRFLENVRFQGGDIQVVENPSRGPRAAIVREFTADRPGFIQRIDAFRVGLAATTLGAGRAKKGDRVFSAVGIELLKVAGDRVSTGEPIALLHTEDIARLDSAMAILRGAYTFADRAPSPRGIILEEMTG